MIAAPGVPVKDGRFDAKKADLNLQVVFDAFVNRIYKDPPTPDTKQYQDLWMFYISAAQLTQQYIVDSADLQIDVAEVKMHRLDDHIQACVDSMIEKMAERHA